MSVEVTKHGAIRYVRHGFLLQSVIAVEPMCGVIHKKQHRVGLLAQCINRRRK